ncbi:uncharacterized protein LOC124929912 [Impatiens glandulifera]|uniref:uncharacterized protein LOC124929912 n=1 Tax=Impatiens glandulifera TaxID=253017 RepID=UPI001FB0B24F|nr:uncharacterized protein LOC124929912 [Impatiens glandulifera]
MGNGTSHRPAGAATGKVILSNGTIFEYEPPMTAAELMLEHPRHVVVEVPHKVCAGGAVKVSTARPLPADKKLDKDKLYLMIPMSKSKPASCSLQEIQKLLLIANKKSALNSKTMLLSSLTGILPLMVRFVHMANKKGRIIDEKIDETKGKGKTELLMEEMWEEKPEFMWLSRTVSGKGWRPSLDTIKEKGVK